MTDVGRLLEADDMRMMVDIGFMALSRGRDAQASAIFAGVVAARPDQEAGHIGTALAMLYRGEVDAALAVLRRLPPSDAVSTFLGLALSRQGDRAGARSVLSGVADTSADPDLRRSAEDLMKAIDP